MDSGAGQSPASPGELEAEAPGIPQSSDRPAPADGVGRCLCTVTVEEYFQAPALRPRISPATWYRFDSRLAFGTSALLDLLDECSATATFFVRSAAAETQPHVVRAIADRGHELGVLGEADLDVAAAAGRRDGLGAVLIRWRDRLEQIVGQRAHGFRAAGGLRPGDQWLLGELAKAGYRYDCSLRSAGWEHPSQQHEGARSAGGVQEIALPALHLAGFELPLGDGTAFRLLPGARLRRAVPTWSAGSGRPYVLHLRSWEFDPGQPRIEGAPLGARIRQYWNLGTMGPRTRDLLLAHRFVSVAHHLGLSLRDGARSAVAVIPAGPELSPRTVAGASQEEVGQPAGARLEVSIVIPCFNETQSLRYLANTLASLVSECAARYRFTFVFVDDCSTDATWAMLHELFGGRSDCVLVRHERNQGIAAAIRTGLQHAPTAIACSIDCDCTYDPHELANMIPLLTEGVGLVTASPYHPEGGVRNVPPWRLVLSKSLSRLYRIVLHQKLFTYTSCFRVYRRRTALDLDVRRPGFLGIAEMAARLDLSGHRIVEYPTTLEVRLLGRSKMRIARTIIGHLGLLLDVARLRLNVPRWTART